MTRLKMLQVTNGLLMVSFALQVATSIVLFLNINVPFLRAIYEVHKYNGLLMIILAGAHIYLNWGWVKANFLKKK